MKKLFILFLLFFTTDSYSSGIASSANTAPCTNTTLETYSGNSNLSADWQPNEIKLRWYNGNTLMDVQSSANTCTYDGTLAVPSTAPNRTGYTFTGWTVRPEINFATIPTNINGTERWAKGWYENADYCIYDTNTGSAWNVNCDSDATYNELQTYEWEVYYEHGVLYGMSLCSTTSGSWGQPGTPTIGTGQYCWCKATGYKATNASVISGSSSVLSWVFCPINGSDVDCTKSCADLCANRTAYNYAFRAALFAPAQ